MSVLAPKQEPSTKQLFVCALAKTQYLIWLPISIISVLISNILLSDYISNEISRIILTATIITLFIFLREFMRHALFVYLLPKAVLVVDIVYTVILITLVYYFTGTSSLPTLHTLIAMGAAGLFAGVVGLSLFDRCVGWKSTWALRPLGTAWIHGKWALMGATIAWLHNQGFLYLLGGLKGSAEVATVSASRLLFMPMLMMMASVTLTLRPRGASWLANGEQCKLQQMIALIIQRDRPSCIGVYWLSSATTEQSGRLSLQKEHHQSEYLAAAMGNSMFGTECALDAHDCLTNF